jgi:hypothetical protein
MRTNTILLSLTLGLTLAGAAANLAAAEQEPAAIDESGVTIESDVEEAKPKLIGDLDDDGRVNVTDFLELMTTWGACPPSFGRQPCRGDLTGDRFVDISDLLELLANWS